MKKILFALLALILVLSACGTATTEPTEAVTEPELVATEETVVGEATDEPVTEATEEPVVEATEEPVAAEPKRIVLGVGEEAFAVHGWMIETDDAFAMSTFGVLETLVKVDFESNMVPCLAESWVQVDELTWQFNLRQGVSFSNGEPFNAAAVVTALDHVRLSPTPPRGVTAETFVAVEAADEYTVIIRTAALDTLVPNRLTSPVTGILAPSAYNEAGAPVDFRNTGTGPFIVVEQVPEQSLSLVKNPNYWGGNVVIDEALALYIPDPQIRAGMLQTGEIDINIHLPVEQLPILEANPELVVLRSPTPRTTTLHLNMSRPPFDDVRVRQAVAYAIDKEAIVFATLEGAGTAGVGPISFTEGWVNDELVGYPYDPEMARQLLADAGYEEGALTVALWTYPARSNLPLSALAIQDMLADVGVNVEIRLAQYEAMSSDVLAGNYDMFIISRNHVLDTYDPEGFFSSDYSCTGSFNMDLFCDEEFDTLLAEARTLTDVEARYDIYRRMQSILVDEQAVGVFLNYTQIINGVRSNVLNFQNHPLEFYFLTADLDIVMP